MNYSEIFHFMRPELTLIVTIALLFLFDQIGGASCRERV